MKIKKISLYSVPYTEDDHFQPLKSKLPEDWLPLKEIPEISTDLEKIGREIKLTATYDEIRNANYMKFELLINDKDENYYAWIESIIIGSQINKGRMIIYYHWDYWRTFIERITPLRGIIVQRKELEKNPPQIVPKIIEVYDETVHDIVNQDKEIAWIYMSLVDPAYELDAGIQRIAFPVHRNSYEKRFRLNDYNSPSTYIDAPSFREVINGSLLKKMNIEEKKLIGCSVSSIAPIKYDRNGDDITIPYNTVEIPTSISIYTNDLIEIYENPLKTYDNVHEYKFTIWDVGNDRFRDELKWWCFPRKEIKFKYDTSGAPTFVPYYVTLCPAETQYYPFLQYLKYYTPYYEELKEIRIDTNKFEVRYASYYWVSKGNNKFQQTFDNFFDGKIKTITKRTDKEDKFNITFEKGSLDEVGIDNIFVLRLEEDEQFTFTAILEDKQSITSKRVREDLIVIKNSDGVWPLQFHAFEKPLKSVPLKNLFLLDNYGYPVNKFEQQRDILNYTVQAVSQNSQMFALFKFNKGSYIDNTEFLVHMTPIDMAQGYFNEYILTVEREAATQRRVDNIISSLSNIAAGAVMGTVMGGPVGGVLKGGLAVAKTIGAGAVTAGLVSGGLSFYQQARLEERLRQRGSLLIREGNDYSWLSNGYLMSLVVTKIDDYSKDLYLKKVNMFGIDCNEIDDDGHVIARLLNEEGPLKLSSLTLNKDIPYEANVYIREKLFNGVLLDPNLSQPFNKLPKEEATELNKNTQYTI